MALRVYMAGPISGLKFDPAESWRQYVKLRLEEGTNEQVKALSPLRNQEYLRQAGVLTAEAKECLEFQCPLTTSRGLTVRDRFDVMNSDVLFVNLLGATKISEGTSFEIAWADAGRIPIVCCMEPTGNPHEHAMLSEMIGFRVPTLDEGIRITRSILAV